MSRVPWSAGLGVAGLRNAITLDYGAGANAGAIPLGRGSPLVGVVMDPQGWASAY